jgi:hypothetical protein
MLVLAAVVERPRVAPPTGWPPVADAPGGWIRLDARTSRDEIAAVVSELATYNRVFDGEPYPRAVWTMGAYLDAIVAADRLILPGGLAAFESGEAARSIEPSCCAGLEGWREWLAFDAGGPSPWMGHDPWPGLQRSDEAVRIWSDLGAGTGRPAADAFALETTAADLRAALAACREDLRAFLGSLSGWAEAVAGRGEALAARFDRAFGVTAP